MADSKLTALTANEAPATEDLVYTVDDPGGTPAERKTTVQALLGLLPIVNGRLTLESGEAIPNSDQTAKTTLYFTPYLGNAVALYDGTAWQAFTFAELSISLASKTADTNFDVYLYDDSGTLTLELLAWSTDTTRATAIALQDGRCVKSGDATRLYLGTIRTTGTTGQCEDSGGRRLVCNQYNRVARVLNAELTTTHTYSSATWRAVNNDTTDGSGRVAFVCNTDADGVEILAASSIRPYANWADYRLALDSTTIPTTTNRIVTRAYDKTATDDIYPTVAKLANQPGAGYHYLQALQSESGSSGSTTYYGSYMLGSIQA